MSPNTLAYMHKQVRASQNRKAHDLLSASDIRYRVSFMVRYPGETPDDYAITRQYLLDEYIGHFMLSIFSFTDETMPVWQDAERFGLTISDPDDPDYNWSHAGMTLRKPGRCTRTRSTPPAGAPRTPCCCCGRPDSRPRSSPPRTGVPPYGWRNSSNASRCCQRTSKTNPTSSASQQGACYASWHATASNRSQAA